MAMQLTPNVNFSIIPWSKLNMIRSQQRRLKPMLRICAAFMLSVWVAASGFGFCSAEPLSAHAKSGEQKSDATAHHHDKAAASADSDHHSHDSDKNSDDEHACCSSLTAAAPSAHQTVLTKPDFGKQLSFNLLWLSQTLTFVQPEAPISRQAQHREFIFTPEVCLGPAFRSHAPPLVG